MHIMQVTRRVGDNHDDMKSMNEFMNEINYNLSDSSEVANFSQTVAL